MEFVVTPTKSSHLGTYKFDFKASKKKQEDYTATLKIEVESSFFPYMKSEIEPIEMFVF